jgi:pyruvate formate lyase activating enzyme
MSNPKTIRRDDQASDEIDLLDQLPSLRKPLAGDVPISKILDSMVQEGELYESLPDSKVHCFACGHHCTISTGGRGICQVRFNLGGKLYVPWGYVAALQCDPTEKKPFFHIYPGSDTLTFGMLGCDLHCPYCQNWDTSQTLRDANAGRPPTEVTPQNLVALGKRAGAKCVASSYNEPLITSEWAVEVFQEAKAAGFMCLYVSNGNATREVLEYIRPYTTGYKIDLKTMNDKNYRKLGAVLEHVLDGVRMVHEMGFWLEIVTLVIPGFNDSNDELREAARFLVSLSPDIPWHVTAFHKDYRMTDPADTDSRTLLRAAEIGYEEGLHYVYAGNRPGQVGEFENTRCPTCQKTLIERYGYVILDYQLMPEGNCPHCGTHIPGIFPKSPREVRLGTKADVYFRRPRAVW